ncbi:MAG: trigger factor [Candidatus Peribacteria bacterium]|nr:trigger factor [Candidatus Peribacteria bacterium]
MSTISEPTKLKQSKVQFVIEYTPEETLKAEEKAVQQMGAQVTVPGFRPGKAPADKLREKLKPEAILEEVVRILVSESLGTISSTHTLRPIIAPNVEIESAKPLKVKVTFIEKPEVTIKGLEKIKIEKTEPKVDDKDVKRMTDYILEQHKKMAEVDRPAAEGDQVTMDFYGVDENKNEIEGTRSSGYQVRIGSKTLIPGFEEELKGLKKGDEKSFQITFPEKYHAEHLRGKPATFTVNMTKVESVDLPELTDAFAKEHLHTESADEFKKSIEKSMREQEEGLDRQKREEKLLDALVAATEVDLADELVEREAQSILVDLDDQLKKQGQTLEQWMEQTERKPEEMQKELLEQGTRRLKLRFGMEKALEMKNIEVTDDEMKTLIDSVLSSSPENERGKLAARYTPGNNEYEEVKWRRKVEKFMDEMLK